MKHRNFDSGWWVVFGIGAVVLAALLLLRAIANHAPGLSLGG